ncbi:hypothetical protein H6P81_013555 [Aristolochia fimbriata]|uniref:Fe2OG dioxygenase domain-containing protein n=1 Tax=Aristolochia fimbriata TaxID=158543 RepID=A0AAV7EF18_ARIFI|nr:hypothetical protein H6P81_013555 [Aristolochia fimbriata]
MPGTTVVMSLPAAATEWPGPVQRVQELADSGLKTLPPTYVHPSPPSRALAAAPIPVIDISALTTTTNTTTPGDPLGRAQAMRALLSDACRHWGIFHVVNHGVPREVLASAMSVSRAFFSLPASEKRRYANNPVTYEGYGSRMGLDPDATLDWNDYFFHHLGPRADPRNKWPRQPENYRHVISRYGDEIVALSRRLLALLSSGLGLPESTLAEAFAASPAEQLGATFRINLYPKCPQPEAALGLSPHSDPGVLTVVQQDRVSGLEVRRVDGNDGAWFRVPPVEDALVVIVGDQMEIATNGVYKSADHRTAVNGEKERMSLVVFVNPEGEKVIGPLEEMVEMAGGERNFDEMSYNEYRKFIRVLGVQGKSILATRASKTKYPTD